MQTSLEKAEETVSARLQETYAWLLTPVQAQPLGPIELQANRISGSDNFYERAGRKLKQDGLLITDWSPDMLRLELDQYIWNDERGWSVNLKTLWEYLTRYCYFPRLLDRDVLLNAVSEGVARLDAPFAYATGINAEGHHSGLLFRRQGQVHFDERSLLIHPSHIQEPPPPEPVIVIKPIVDGAKLPPDPPGPGPKPPVPPVEQKTTRYYGRVALDPQRVNKSISELVAEVLEHFTSLVGCEVTVTLEIQAKHPAGFEDGTVRTVGENSRTLKFEHFEFEKG